MTSGHAAGGDQQAPGVELFEPAFVHVLESLALAGRRLPSGRAAGQWRSRASGSSVEFSDFRTYTPGDEFRRIDWNAYARLEKLFVRLFRAEEDLTLSLMVDASTSMAWGKPPKLRVAAQLAGALAFVALHTGERVDLAACRAAGGSERLAGLRGEAATWPAWRLLEHLEGSGATDLNAALAAHAASASMRGGGLTVVISDLFSPTGYQSGIDALLARRQDLMVVHLLAPDELSPPADLAGEWRLLDVEGDEPIEASISPAVLRSYRRLLESFTAEVAEFCRRRGVTYLQLSSSVDVPDVVVRTFRAAGILV